MNRKHMECIIKAVSEILEEHGYEFVLQVGFDDGERFNSRGTVGGSKVANGALLIQHLESTFKEEYINVHKGDDNG